MIKKNLDWSLYDQIENNRVAAAQAEWQAKVERAKRIGALEARMIVIFLGVVLLLSMMALEVPN